jgi:hypothetical protein
MQLAKLWDSHCDHQAGYIFENLLFNIINYFKFKDMENSSNCQGNVIPLTSD